MTTIHIANCTGYTKHTFLERLRSGRGNTLTVSVPKFFGTEPGMLEQDYYRALYVGQLLGRIAPGIGHTLPDPRKPGEFVFMLKTDRREELAGTLARINEGYNGDDDAYTSFDLGAAAFVANLGEEETIHCPCFLAVLEEYDYGSIP